MTHNDLQERLFELLALSHELGREERHLAILGEGNTSVDCADGTFWVKASGGSLGSLEEAGVSRVRFGPILALMEHAHMEEQEIEQALLGALDAPYYKKPSVETFLHALCLHEGGARWVGHTHSVAVNQILCSALGSKPFLKHIYPDAIVVCGKAPAVVPYVDPGFALAKVVREELRRYRALHHQPPKLLLMENHGPVALGQSAKEVLNIMVMADKWARILWGAYAIGGPNFLPEDETERIDQRLDEHYRRKALQQEEL